MTSLDLIEAIQTVVQNAPLELVERLCLLLERKADWQEITVKTFSILHDSVIRNLMSSILSQAVEQGREPSEIALALRTACAVEAHHRKEPQLELVWSGPLFQPFQLRRTDEALLEIIEMAISKITLVSFALYKIDRLCNALTCAVERGVKVRLFMEVEKTQPPNLRSLYGEFLARNMACYGWAAHKRLQADHGAHGVLHAKSVVADGKYLLVSSANLTEYAMSLNIETGLLVRGGKLPQQVDRILDDYISRAIFEEYKLA